MPLQRHLHLVGIAKIAGAVEVGAAHHLDQEVDAVGFGERGQLLLRQHVEHLHQHHPSRGGRRSSDDTVAPVGTHDGPALDHAVGLQVLQGPDAAMATHRSDQLLRHGTGIETRTPFLRQPLQGASEVGLANARTKGRHFTRIEKDIAGGGVTAQQIEAKVRHAPVMRIDLEALTRQADGRCQAPGQGKASIMCGDMDQRGRLSGNPRRQGAVHGTARHHLALFIEVHLTVGRQRCPLTPVDHHLFAQRGAHRHRRIEGIATGAQDLHARLRCGGMGAGHGSRRRRLGGSQAPQEPESKKAPRRSFPGELFHGRLSPFPP